MEKIFKGLEGQALIQALQNSSFLQEQAAVERTLTPDQQTDYAVRQQTLAERKTEIEDNIKDYCKPLKDEMKEIDAERKTTARITKKGYIETNETLYWMQDFDNKQMLAYDSNGELVKTRRMKREEKQMMIVGGSTTQSQAI